MTNDHKECGKRKIKSQQNIVKLYGIFWGGCLHALQSEAMSDTKYNDMYENYKNNCPLNKLNLLCVVVDSEIIKFYSAFHTLKAFYMIRHQSGEMVTNYFDRFK